MIATTLLLAALQVTPPALAHTQPTPVPPPATANLPIPPADLTELPELRLQRPWGEMQALSDYVRDEVSAGRCAIEGSSIRVDLAVQIAANGQVRHVRPRAIQCPTVEQFASGVMSRMARSNVAAPGEDRWYRTALVFAWK